MKFTKFTVESGEIASRTEIDTDRLIPVRLDQARQVVAYLKGGGAPVQVSGDEKRPVYVGLGMHPSIG